MNTSNTPLKVLGVRSSRRKRGGAIQRHFAGWKDLLYAIDTATGILIVRPATSVGSGTPIVVGLADTSVLRIPLRRITVLPHVYAPEGAHILSITCESIGGNGAMFGGYCWLGRGSDSSSIGSNSKSSEDHTLSSSSSSSSSSSDQHGDVNIPDEGTYELYEKPLRHKNTTITTGQGEIVKDELEIQLRMESENDLTTWQLILSEHIRQQQMSIDIATAVGLKAIASYLKKRLHLQSIYSLSEPYHVDIHHTLSRSPFDLQSAHIPANTSPIKWAHHRTSRSNSVGSSSGINVMNQGHGLNTVNSISEQYRERIPSGDVEIRDCKTCYDENDRKRELQEEMDEDDEDYLVLREEDDYSIVDHTSIPPMDMMGNHHHNHNHSIPSKPTVTRLLPSSMRPLPVSSASSSVPLSRSSAPSSSSTQAGSISVPGGLSARTHRSAAIAPPLLSVDSKKCGGAIPDTLVSATANNMKSLPFSLSAGSSGNGGSSSGSRSGSTTTTNTIAHSRIMVSPRYLRGKGKIGNVHISAGNAPINTSISTTTPTNTTPTSSTLPTPTIITATTATITPINVTTPTATTIPIMTSSSIDTAMSARPRPSIALARMLQPSDGSNLWSIPVPKLQTLLMTVGTRGDVVPFIVVGKRLKRDGHRVRLATHECFRSLVLEAGLEFFPLAGDPRLLSEFMVKTSGCVLPTSTELLREFPQNLTMLQEIIHSCWRACVDDETIHETIHNNSTYNSNDSNSHTLSSNILNRTTNTTTNSTSNSIPNPSQSFATPSSSSIPFRAQVIISNPVTYGHIHCAEALGCPLHLLFPQPWTPTKAFPHPLAVLPSMFYRQKHLWSLENLVSYQVVDRVVWMSLENTINQFRVHHLGLAPVRMLLGEGGWNLVDALQVPFMGAWSPSLFPRPKDWPTRVEVVGSIFEECLSVPSPPPPLAASSSKQQTTTGADDDDNTTTTTTNNNNDNNIQHPHHSNNTNNHTHHLNSHTSQPHIPPELRTFFADEDDGLSNVLLDRPTATLPPSSLSSSSSSSPIPPPSPPSSSSSSSSSLGRNRIVFIGFGSMVIEDPRTLLELMLQGAALANVRVVVQAGWSEEKITRTDFLAIARDAQRKAWLAHLADQEEDDDDERDGSEGGAEEEEEDDDRRRGLGLGARQGRNRPPLSPLTGHSGHIGGGGVRDCGSSKHHTSEISMHSRSRWQADRDAVLIGSCPHSWLFQRVAAVVHHGGAGTTAAGLRVAKPTWICPFFGDQFLWGEMVKRIGCGPSPCPVKQLSLHIVAESLQALLSPSARLAARLIADKIHLEDGATAAVEAFYRRLPLSSMLCDVSVYMGESRLAEIYCEDCGLKMTKEMSYVVHANGGSSPCPVVAGGGKGSEASPCPRADSGNDSGDATDAATGVASGGGIGVNATIPIAMNDITTTATADGVSTAAADGVTTTGTSFSIPPSDDALVNPYTQKPPTSPLPSSTPISISSPKNGIFSPPPFPLSSPSVCTLGNTCPPVVSLMSHHHQDHHHQHQPSHHHQDQQQHPEHHNLLHHHRIYPCCHVDWRARRLNLTSKHHWPSHALHTNPTTPPTGVSSLPQTISHQGIPSASSPNPGSSLNPGASLVSGAFPLVFDHASAHAPVNVYEPGLGLGLGLVETIDKNESLSSLPLPSSLSSSKQPTSILGAQVYRYHFSPPRSYDTTTDVDPSHCLSSAPSNTQPNDSIIIVACDVPITTTTMMSENQSFPSMYRDADTDENTDYISPSILPTNAENVLLSLADRNSCDGCDNGASPCPCAELEVITTDAGVTATDADVATTTAVTTATATMAGATADAVGAVSEPFPVSESLSLTDQASSNRRATAMRSAYDSACRMKRLLSTLIEELVLSDDTSLHDPHPATHPHGRTGMLHRPPYPHRDQPPDSRYHSSHHSPPSSLLPAHHLTSDIPFLVEGDVLAGGNMILPIPITTTTTTTTTTSLPHTPSTNNSREHISGGNNSEGMDALQVQGLSIQGLSGDGLDGGGPLSIEALGQILMDLQQQPQQQQQLPSQNGPITSIDSIPIIPPTNSSLTANHHNHPIAPIPPTPPTTSASDQIVRMALRSMLRHALNMGVKIGNMGGVGSGSSEGSAHTGSSAAKRNTARALAHHVDFVEFSLFLLDIDGGKQWKDAPIDNTIYRL